jgi:arginine exporter protein ArgO
VAEDANGDALPAMSLVLGVFLGSAAWWFVLSGATSLFRAALSARGLRWVNRISGTIIAAFGVLALSGLGARLGR